MSDDVAIGTLGVLFAAFCLWLAVRIINRRERWAIRVAVSCAVVFVIAVGLAALSFYLDRYVIGGGP